MQDRQNIPDNSPEELVIEKSIPKKQLNLMTFNIACLPLLGAINKKFLRPNHERAELITQRIIKWNNDATTDDAPDIICFQEALAIETRVLLRKKLSLYYPYDSEKLGQHLRGSGLFVFSKYPFIDAHYKQFPNVMVGTDQLAIKGFIGSKLQMNENEFITVYATHLESNNAMAEDKQTEIAGATISWRRGEQLGLIYHDMQVWSRKIPPSHPHLKHAKTFLLGDLNTGLNDERRMYSFSTGKSNNGYEKDMKKYPGQYDLFTLLQHTIPDNFLEIRKETTEPTGKKVIVSDLLEKAKRENKFVGTNIPDSISIENKQYNSPVMPYQADPKIIDGCFCSKHMKTEENKQISPEFVTKILSFQLNGKGGASDISLSDHFPILGIWRKTTLFSKSITSENNKEAENSNRNCLTM